MQRVFIVSYARTPFGAYLGKLKQFSAVDLATMVIRSIADRVNGYLGRDGCLESQVDQVILGNVLSAGLGQCPSTQAARRAGLSPSTVSYSIDKVCASGMKAIMAGFDSIAMGRSDIVIAGGMESMSNVPHYLFQDPRRKFGSVELADGILHDGLTNSASENRDVMGRIVQRLADEHNITRKEQDDHAIESYARAIAAKDHFIREEIVPIRISEHHVMDQDEALGSFNPSKMERLKACFGDEQGRGTLTAGNSSKLSDGAAAVMLMGDRKMKELGLSPIAEIVSCVDVSVDPDRFPETPSLAVERLLDESGLSASDIDYYEINEAFSAVVVLNARRLGISMDRINIHGGAVSLGHPVGCSGARIVGSLGKILETRDGRYGIAGICNGGGGGSGMLLKRE